MRKKTINKFALGICVLIGAATLAYAHQQRVELTSVLFNERSGYIEVMHRLYVHDAEHVALELWGGRIDLLDNEDDRKRMGDYARARFELKTPAGAALPLAPVGEETDGPYFWVYEETPIVEGLDEIIVDNRILRDVWSEQANLVNVERGEFRGSLSFHGADGARSLRLIADNPN